MYTKNELSGRTRRQYSAEFKQEVVTLCRQPGMSVASVARRHGINHNIVHRWIREHLAPTSNYAPDEMPGHLPGFVPVAVPVKNQDVIEVNRERPVIPILNSSTFDRMMVST